jgi:hypothetical protein
MSGPLWLIPPAWSGETCFIVGGGVSVETQPVERLRGRKRRDSVRYKWMLAFTIVAAVAALIAAWPVVKDWLK